MKKLLIIMFAGLLVSAGCVSHTGSVTFPEPSANFTPKETYAVSFDKLWDATLNALDKNRIATISSDKASGTIQTDAVEGPSANMGFFVNQATHYSYNLSLRNQTDGTIRLNVFCKIEDTVSSAHGSTQWHDVTSKNGAEAHKLETWLYEQIETQLK